LTSKGKHFKIILTSQYSVGGDDLKILDVIKEDYGVFKKDLYIKIIIFGMLLVPLIYAGIYLGAFWDPYGRTEELAIAFVNADAGVETDDGYLNIGRDTEANLRANTDFKWVFIDDRKTALAGVDEGDYYAMIAIPEDFTKSINQIENGELVHPSLEYVSNDKKNFIISMISKKAADNIQSEINQSILASLTASLTDGLASVQDGLISADNGAVQLNDGLLTLKLQMPKVTSGLTDLSEGSETFLDKMTDASDGAVTLKDGILTLNDQIPELQDGIQTLFEGSGIFKDKLVDVEDGIHQINDAVSVLGDTAPQLQDGVDQLADGSQQLSDGIEDLASGAGKLASAAVDIDGGAEAIDAGLSSAAGASGELTDAMKMSEALMAPIYKDLDTKMTTMTAKLTQAYGIVATEYAGATLPPIQSGLGSVMAGMDTMFATLNGSDPDALAAVLQTTTLENLIRGSLAKLNGGIQGVRDAQVSGVYLMSNTSRTNLTAAVSLLNDADAIVVASGDYINLVVVEEINGQVFSGLKSLDTGLRALSSGADDLSEGTGAYVEALPEFMDGFDTLQEGADSLTEGLETFQGKIPTLSNGIQNLSAGTETLSNSMLKINSAETDIHDGITALYESMPALSNGVAEIADGGEELVFGMQKLTDVAGTLNDGIVMLSDQMPDVEDGINQLYEGSVQLHDGLESGIADLTDSTKFSAKAIQAYADEVAVLDDQDVYPVDNYGQSLSPYFDSLALWVGSLVTFVLLKFKRPRDYMEEPAKYVFGKYLTFLSISIAQSIALSTVILLIGLRPVSIIGFYAFNILLSICFVAIQQLLNFTMGNAGKLLSMVLLVLQLTSANGTFPVELEPTFFQAISKFMPFTYSIIGLRELISGIQWPHMWHSILMLVLMTIVTLFTTMGIYQQVAKKQKSFTKEALNETI
jgi:putative membrane protein